MLGRRIPGTITIFLSFIMIFLLSLIGTMIDVTRSQVADAFAYRALLNSVETQFTNYCEELYDDYYIFMLYEKEGIIPKSYSEFVSSLEDSLLYSFEPEKYEILQGIQAGMITTNPLDLQLIDVNVEQVTSALDYNGELFLSEIYDYMRYQVVGNLASGTLERLNLLSESKNTMKVMKKKTTLDEKVAKLDQTVQSIMEEVEGLYFRKGGLVYELGGKLRTQNHFAKIFCTEIPSGKSVGVNNQIVYEALEEKYMNPVEVLTELRDAETNEDYIKAKEKCNWLINEAKESIVHIENALDLLSTLNGDQRSLIKDIGEYEVYLNGEKTSLSEEIYNGFAEELGDIKKYISDDRSESVTSSLLSMREPLYKNKEVLTKFSQWDTKVEYWKSNKTDEMITLIDDTIQYFEEYSIEELIFDYSTFNFEQQVENPSKLFSTLLGDGILGLVMDEVENVSKESLSVMNMPSLYQMDQQESSFGGDQENEKISEELKKDKQDQSTVSSIVDAMENGLGSENFVSEIASNVAKKYLLTEYAEECFVSYEDESRSEEEKMPTSLLYEKEYLINGAYSDRENIQSVVMRTIFLRTVFNYISLLSDKEARMQANTAATAIIGFTGFTPLIVIMKQVLLMIWAFEESLIDTRALLEGVKVPFIKRKGEVQLKYSELLVINKQLIKNKVDAMKKKTAPQLSLSYSDYLKFYMFLVGDQTLSYRMMDLIQANMQLRYDSEFCFQKCYFGVRVSLSCEVPGKFLNIPFVKRFTGYEGNRHKLSVSTEYSY